MEEQWVKADKLNLYTDASSTQGYGLVLGPKWVYGSWPELLKMYLLLKMYPITLAFIMFREELKGKSILIHTDNKALVHVINNKTSKDTRYFNHLILHKIILIGLEFNIRVRAEHIPGHINVQADSLSCLQISKFKEAAPE